MVTKRYAIEKLKRIGCAKQILSGPVTISGVGNQKSGCHDGVYSIRLPLVGGENAVISGLCMSKVTI